MAGRRSRIIEDDDAEDTAGEQRQRTRIVDWKLATLLPIQFLIVSIILIFVLPEIIRDLRINIFILLVLFALVPISLTVQLIGYVFDTTTDRLRYPFYTIRRRVQLSEIRDANCQNITKRWSSDWGRAIGESNKQSHVRRRYYVNLSGRFGARRLVFGSKYKRDQFLSALKQYAPRVKITRWS